MLIEGDKEFNLVEFKANTVFESTKKLLERWFWMVFERLTSNEKKLYLRFVWGRSILPKRSIVPYTHKVVFLYDSNNPDKCLPIGSTCFFTLKLPAFSSLELMYNKLLYSINNCFEIDADFTIR